MFIFLGRKLEVKRFCTEWQSFTPIQNKGKITVLCILMFIFLGRKLEVKRFCTTKFHQHLLPIPVSLLPATKACVFLYRMHTRTQHITVISINQKLMATFSNWQIWRTILLFYNTFITVLYMFRATSCSSSGGQIVLIQHLVSSLYVMLCTGRPLTESDDTGCCINKIWPPDDEHDVAQNM